MLAVALAVTVVRAVVALVIIQLALIPDRLIKVLNPEILVLTDLDMMAV